MFSILVVVAVADNGAVLTLLHLLTSLLVITAISSPRLLIIALLIILLAALPPRLLLLTLAVLPRDRSVNEVFVYLRHRGQDRATEAVSGSVNLLWYRIFYVLEEDKPLDKIVHSHTSRTELRYQDTKLSRLLALISITILILT